MYRSICNIIQHYNCHAMMMENVYSPTVPQTSKQIITLAKNSSL